MNNLYLKTIVLTAIFIFIVQLVVGVVVEPFLPRDEMLLRIISLLLALVISAFVSYFMFSKVSLLKTNSAVQGFFSGIASAGLLMFLFVILLSGTATVATMIFLVIGATAGGYLAGKK